MKRVWLNILTRKTGTGLGGMDFSWTAAIYLDLNRDAVAAKLAGGL